MSQIRWDIAKMLSAVAHPYRLGFFAASRHTQLLVADAAFMYVMSVIIYVPYNTVKYKLASNVVTCSFRPKYYVFSQVKKQM